VLYFRILNTSLLLIISSANNSKLFAQETEPIQTDRPDLTESAFTVPAGYIQLESGLLKIYNNSNTQLHLHPTLLLKYGLSKIFELRFNIDFATYQKDGTKEFLILPIAVGVKIAISEEKGIIPKTAFIGHLKIPAGGESDLASTYFAPSFRFTMQHTLSKKISLGYNLGSEWSGITAEPIFIYTITSAMSLSSAWGAYIELFGYAPQFNTAEHSLDGGFTYLINNNCLADVSVGYGLTSNAPKYFLSAGFSFRINTHKNRKENME
jgi:hypothetical protein